MANKNLIKQILNGDKKLLPIK